MLTFVSTVALLAVAAGAMIAAAGEGGREMPRPTSVARALHDGQPASITPADVAESLLRADRAHGLAASSRGFADAFSPVLSQHVMMPKPGGGFARGRDQVLEGMLAGPGAATSRVSWRPVRVGISADGLHGFTLGYMTQTPADGAPVHFKYLAYWIREQGEWRAVAYRRTRAPGAATDTAMMAASLPSALVTAALDTSARTVMQQGLMRAEASFSARAQQVGLGNAFAEFGHADAVNTGGPQAANFVVGAAQIARSVGGSDMSASPVTWGADTAIVASSDDLGVTFGVIRANGAAADAGAPGAPFFTIWRRASPGAPWRYIAE